ncbi:MAG TPA: hypothetical protein DEF45_09680 [Rhodopirellula sp.]|nr:hypothetical protein [Rhodopirellula sp.]
MALLFKMRPQRYEVIHCVVVFMVSIASNGRAVRDLHGTKGMADMAGMISMGLDRSCIRSVNIATASPQPLP